MSGMGSRGPYAARVVVVAFHATLTHQLLVVFAVVIVAALIWNVLRNVQYRRATAQGHVEELSVARCGVEPAGRRAVRIAFGGFWVIDGLLQLQASMPLGLPKGVFSQAASGAPHWVHQVVNVSITTWTNHPITMAVAAVWIQTGIGVVLLVAPRGAPSRGAGLLSIGWGAVVWVFGEAFGGIFTPGQSMLLGAPGAALFYVLAGSLLVLPERAWSTPQLGRRLLRALGFLFIAGGILQALPGRNSWAGHATTLSTAGPIASMAQQMAATAQPRLFGAITRWFASFDGAHGFGVNLFVMVALLAIGGCLVAGDRRLVRLGVTAGCVLCLVDWVLVQDLGFFGGVGTDPNSMLPILAVLVAGYLAVTKPRSSTELEPTTPWSLPGWLDENSSSSLLQWVATSVAVGVVLLGAVPMALAASHPHLTP